MVLSQKEKEVAKLGLPVFTVSFFSSCPSKKRAGLNRSNDSQ